MIDLKKLTVSRIPNLIWSERMALAAAIPDGRALLDVSHAELKMIVRREVRIHGFDPAAVLQEAEMLLNWLTGEGIDTITIDEEIFPPMLREIFDPPYLLYSRGTLPPADIPAIAIVGTRHAAGRAEQAAFRLGMEAGLIGVPVLSGLAAGIDSAAHTGAMAGGGCTWGVLGSGFAHIYPRQSVGLAERMVAEGGGLLSELAPFVPPVKYNFPARNRIISGLSRSVCIVEAPERSGALITADYALEQGRDVYVHEEGLFYPLALGTKRLAEEGAPVLSSMRDVCRDWGWNPAIVPKLSPVLPAAAGGECERGTGLQGGHIRPFLLASGQRRGSLCRFQDTWYKIDE